MRKKSLLKFFAISTFAIITTSVGLVSSTRISHSLNTNKIEENNTLKYEKINQTLKDGGTDIIKQLLNNESYEKDGGNIALKIFNEQKIVNNSEEINFGSDFFQKILDSQSYFANYFSANLFSTDKINNYLFEKFDGYKEAFNSVLDKKFSDEHKFKLESFVTRIIKSNYIQRDELIILVRGLQDVKSILDVVTGVLSISAAVLWAAAPWCFGATIGAAITATIAAALCGSASAIIGSFLISYDTNLSYKQKAYNIQTSSLLYAIDSVLGAVIPVYGIFSSLKSLATGIRNILTKW